MTPEGLEAAAEQAIRGRLREWWSRLALVWRLLLVGVPTALIAAGASWAASPHSTLGDHARRIGLLELRMSTAEGDGQDIEDRVREQTKAIQGLDRSVSHMSGHLEELLRRFPGGAK